MEHVWPLIKYFTAFALKFNYKKVFKNNIKNNWAFDLTL